MPTAWQPVTSSMTRGAPGGRGNRGRSQRRPTTSAGVTTRRRKSPHPRSRPGTQGRTLGPRSARSDGPRSPYGGERWSGKRRPYSADMRPGRQSPTPATSAAAAAAASAAATAAGAPARRGATSGGAAGGRTTGGGRGGAGHDAAAAGGGVSLKPHAVGLSPTAASTRPGGAGRTGPGGRSRREGTPRGGRRGLRARSASSGSGKGSKAGPAVGARRTTLPFKCVVFAGNNPTVLHDVLAARWWWEVEVVRGPTSVDTVIRRVLPSADFVWKPTLFVKRPSPSRADVTLHTVEAEWPGDQQLVNHFPSIHCLTSKSGLLRSMSRFYSSQLLSHVFDNLPSTYILHSKAGKLMGNGEFKRFLRHFKALAARDYSASPERSAMKHCEGNMWLIKPAYLNQGRGIEVFKELSKMRQHVLASAPTGGKQTPATYRDEWVVQKYLERPLLLNGRKFDIRVWVLVDEAFRVWMYRDGYLRTSSEQFSTDLGTKGGQHNRMVHLTNYCMQKHSKNLGHYEDGNTLKYEDLQAYITSNFPDSKFSVRDNLLPRVKRLVLDSLFSVRDALPVGKSRRCFELFGYDIMVDDDFRAWLIEVNTNPYISSQNSWHNQLLYDMVEDMVQLVVDPMFPPPSLPTPGNSGGESKEARKRAAEWTSAASTRSTGPAYSSADPARPNRFDLIHSDDPSFVPETSEWEYHTKYLNTSPGPRPAGSIHAARRAARPATGGTGAPLPSSPIRKPGFGVRTRDRGRDRNAGTRTSPRLSPRQRSRDAAVGAGGTSPRASPRRQKPGGGSLGPGLGRQGPGTSGGSRGVRRGGAGWASAGGRVPGGSSPRGGAPTAPGGPSGGGGGGGAAGATRRGAGGSGAGESRGDGAGSAAVRARGSSEEHKARWAARVGEAHPATLPLNGGGAAATGSSTGTAAVARATGATTTGAGAGTGAVSDVEPRSSDPGTATSTGESDGSTGSGASSARGQQLGTDSKAQGAGPGLGLGGDGDGGGGGGTQGAAGRPPKEATDSSASSTRAAGTDRRACALCGSTQHLALFEYPNGDKEPVCPVAFKYEWREFSIEEVVNSANGIGLPAAWLNWYAINKARGVDPRLMLCMLATHNYRPRFIIEQFGKRRARGTSGSSHGTEARAAGAERPASGPAGSNTRSAAPSSRGGAGSRRAGSPGTGTRTKRSSLPRGRGSQSGSRHRATSRPRSSRTKGRGSGGSGSTRAHAAGAPYGYGQSGRSTTTARAGRRSGSTTASSGARRGTQLRRR